MRSLVIADTSCLIVLEKISQLGLLRKIYSEIIITPEIQQEYGEKLPEWVNITRVQDAKKQQILELELDKGEASAIALAFENNDALILMDEKKGRRIAKKLGLHVLGTLGVIIKAKEQGLIDSIKAQIDKLQMVNFRISDELVRKILDKYDK